ncbi:hypothetical protein GCM10007063_33520 [Lentibacillus kapialis]|uniref:Uncharacterized protein n=1 Tax=Lentibacillus kapialis TaxID=340214 RepID=A0A917V1D4_9BACI|nr:hypothetical protein GCM10007063_33520 [Lentibacillus kapialis]
MDNNVEGRNETSINMEHKVVILKQSYQLPLKAVNSLVKESGEPRLRLLPPYREQLSQSSYANVYSRIGLPLDIDTSRIQIDLL